MPVPSGEIEGECGEMAFRGHEPAIGYTGDAIETPSDRLDC